MGKWGVLTSNNVRSSWTGDFLKPELSEPVSLPDCVVQAGDRVIRQPERMILSFWRGRKERSRSGGQ